MLTYPHIDPVAFHIGPLPVHWYGLMYLIGFAVVWVLLLLPSRRKVHGLSADQISDVVFYGSLGAIIGGRVGYMLFYNFSTLIEHPLTLFKTWEGGMSFHGGLLGVLIAVYLCARKFRTSFFTLTDTIAPMIPIGLGAGRIGNFINGELWGRITHLPWGMMYPNAGPLPRHPSQLYEAFFEGLVLFFILWFYSAKPRPRMAVSGLFALGYGIFRFVLEFFRQPDPQLGFIAWGWLSMGQLLSLPLMAVGIGFLWCAYRRSDQKVVSCNNI